MLENLSKSHIDIKVDEVMVQEMENGVGEALIGFTRDPVVGPIVTVAAGGILAEVYKDYSEASCTSVYRNRSTNDTKCSWI